MSFSIVVFADINNCQETWTQEIIIRVSPIPKGLTGYFCFGFEFLKSKTKVNDLHPEWLPLMIHQHDVIQFQICMDQTETFEGI